MCRVLELRSSVGVGVSKLAGFQGSNGLGRYYWGRKNYQCT